VLTERTKYDTIIDRIKRKEKVLTVFFLGKRTSALPDKSDTGPNLSSV
jgi:hypothetical protein